jgi:cobalt-zinc-cadmium efflux system membrane fusion protein
VAGNLKDALVVPDSAVLRDAENEPFVYVATGQDAKGMEQFGRRKVKLGESHDSKTQIVNGLQPGDRIAADGSLFLQFANSLQ